MSGDVEIHFLNGSIVRMIVHSEKLDIATPYGQLAVPVRDLRAIEFGLHSGGRARGHRVRRRRAGQQRIPRTRRGGRDAGEVRPARLSGRPRSEPIQGPGDLTPRKDVVKQLPTNHPRKDLKTTSEDKVVTPSFTIVGRILTPTIKAKTELFGQVGA